MEREIDRQTDRQRDRARERGRGRPAEAVDNHREGSKRAGETMREKKIPLYIGKTMIAGVKERRSKTRPVARPSSNQLPLLH